MLGRALSALRRRGRRVPRGRTCAALGERCGARRALSSTTEHAARSGRARRRRRRSRGRQRPARASGQPDDELAAAAGPVAARLDGAAVQLDQACAPASGRCPGRPRAGRARPALHEQVEDARAAARARCRRRCRARASSRPRRRRAARSSAMCAARARCTWPRCSGGSRAPARAASGRRPARAARRGRRATRRWPRSLDQRPRDLDGAADERCELDRLLSSSILPRVMRETSSRSSTSRVMCCDLALDDLARAA